MAKSRYLQHVPHEERGKSELKDLEQSIKRDRGSIMGSIVPTSGSRINTRRMTKLLMDEFAEISSTHRASHERKHGRASHGNGVMLG